MFEIYCFLNVTWMSSMTSKISKLISPMHNLPLDKIHADDQFFQNLKVLFLKLVQHVIHDCMNDVLRHRKQFWTNFSCRLYGRRSKGVKEGVEHKFSLKRSCKNKLNFLAKR